MSEVSSELFQLRNVAESDLPVFFEQQLDPESNYMAAFIRENHADREAFMLHWQKITTDENIHIRTVIYLGKVAGYILSHDWLGDPEVGYWIGKEFWGRGIATQGLGAFLEEFDTRPLYAHAAKDNHGSLRVLEKCGFEIIREARAFANARGKEVDEYILKLAK